MNEAPKNSCVNGQSPLFLMAGLWSAAFGQTTDGNLANVARRRIEHPI